MNFNSESRPPTLKARDALSDQVMCVSAATRPMAVLPGTPSRRAVDFAVFDGVKFSGLVKMQDALSAPERTFADLLPSGSPPSVREDASLEGIRRQMETHALDALPVCDEGGQCVGLLTRESLSRALLTQERRISAEPEERFRAQYRGLPVPTYTWQRSGEDFVFIGCNAAALAFTLGRVADLLGNTARAMYRDMPDVLADFSRCVAERTTITRAVKYRFHTADEIKDTIVRYVFTPPDLVMVHAEDTSERKRAEERLAYQAYLLEHVHDAIMATNAEFVLTAWNRAAEQLYGWTATEAIGRKVDEVISTEFTNAQLAEALRLLSETGYYRVEVVQYRRDGRPLNVEGTTMALRDAQGQISGYVSVNRDITGRKRAEQVLEEQSRIMEAFFQHTITPLVILDKDFNFVRVNQAYAHACARAVSDFPGHNHFEFYPSEAKAIFQHVVEAKTPFQAIAHPFVFPDHPEWGVTYWDWILVPLLDHQGAVEFLMFSLNDVTERKRAEASRRDAESRLQAVLSNAPITIFATDNHGVFTLSEGKGLERVGLKPGEHVGMSALDLYGSFPLVEHSGELTTGTDVVRRALAGEMVTASTELRGVYFENHIGPLRDKDGKVIGIVGVATDITERKQSEASLRQSEERYRNLVELSPDMISVHSEGKILYTNLAAAKLVGVPHPQNLIGRSMFEFIHPDARQSLAARLEEIYGAGEQRRFIESQFTRLDGQVIDIEVSSTPVTFQGKAARQVIVRDITERKRAEAALRENEGRLKVALAAVNMAVFNQDRNLRYTWVHQSHLGYTTERVVGKTDAELLPPQAAEKVGAVKRRVIATGVGARDEVSMPWNEQTLHFDLVVEPLRNANSEVVGITGATLDITERKRAEAEHARLYEQTRASRARMQVLSQQLIEAQEAERRHIARELHDEIGQVLTAVKTNLQAIQLSGDPSTIGPRLSESIDIVERALRQTRDLALDLRPSLLDDFGLAPALEWYVGHQAERSGFTVDFVAEPPVMKLPAGLESICFRVAQAALTNVVRHAQAKHARVELRQTETELQLVVRDDGVGFDVSAAWERAAHATTLGLLAMQERVQLAGGQINIESAPTRGTEIRARFPLTPAADDRIERGSTNREP